MRPVFSYRGKTKDVAEFLRGERVFLLLRFKDNILGRRGREDSGGNEVVGSLDGKGAASAALCEFFLKAFEKAGVPTHFLGRPAAADIIVEKTERIGVEFICRNRAWGSYLVRLKNIRRAKPLARFDRPVIEYTLKSDALDDPILDSREILAHVTPPELSQIRSIILKINRVSAALCRRAGLTLVDFKAEFGRRKKTGAPRNRVASEILLIDDFSCDTARFFDGKRLIGHLEACRALGITLAPPRRL